MAEQRRAEDARRARNAFAEKSFAVTILLLMFVPALPFPTGGSRTCSRSSPSSSRSRWCSGAGRSGCRKWKQRELGTTMTGKAVPFVIRRVRWFEKFSRPEARRPVRSALVHPIDRARDHRVRDRRVLAPPFSSLDTLPALGVVTISLAIILEDIVILGVGTAIGAGGIVLIVTIGAAIAHFLKNLF